MSKTVGHTLLAKLGKKRLRPGGKKATNWLIDKGDFNNKKILEVASNMGTTSIELAKRFDIAITAIDLDEKALEIANSNATRNKVDSKIEFIKANALELPFEKESFDVILNEALLTMLSNNNKEKAVKGYYEVLKPGGILLTHDVCLFTDDINLQKEIISALTRSINVHVQPKTVNEWVNIFSDAGYKDIKYISGPMTLMNPIGMIKDEGLFRTIKIIRNGNKKENKEQFRAMRNTFKKYKEYLGFVAIVSNK